MLYFNGTIKILDDNHIWTSKQEIKNDNIFVLIEKGPVSIQLTIPALKLSSNIIHLSVSRMYSSSNSMHL